MYSETLLNLFRSRAHAGDLTDATHFGSAGAPVRGQGPYVQLWLRAAEGRIEAVRYRAWGCPGVLGCLEALSVAAEAGEVRLQEPIVAGWFEPRVGPLPPGKDHCPRLAAEAWNALWALKSVGSAETEREEKQPCRRE